jgi:hypothetical protein
MDLVVVTFNYRVGPYGFLASEAVREDGDLNAGLLDQRKALEWVQQHISKVRVNIFVANCVGLIVYMTVRRQSSTCRLRRRQCWGSVYHAPPDRLQW